MPEPSNTEVIPSGEFEPIAFWQQHKGKIVFYVVLLVVGLAAFAIYQITTARSRAETEQLFAQAKSVEDFKRIISNYPASMAAGNASLMLAEKLRSEGKYDDAVSTLRGFTTQFPAHPLISGAWLSLGGSLEAQGKKDEALQTYQQLTSKYPDSYAAPMAVFAQANILKAEGKTEEARHVYENLLAQFPKSYFAGAAMREMRLLRK